MRVEVLNGVNLDVLGRRDPELYGGLSLNELERRIYEWAKELDVGVRCRQTNHEGQYVDWIHEVSEMAELLSLARQRLTDAQLWINPDCGLKTRKWEEVRPALVNMVAAAREMRAAS